MFRISTILNKINRCRSQNLLNLQSLVSDEGKGPWPQNIKRVRQNQSQRFKIVSKLQGDHSINNQWGMTTELRVWIWRKYKNIKEIKNMLITSLLTPIWSWVLMEAKEIQRLWTSDRSSQPISQMFHSATSLQGTLTLIWLISRHSARI